MERKHPPALDDLVMHAPMPTDCAQAKPNMVNASLTMLVGQSIKARAI